MQGLAGSRKGPVGDHIEFGLGGAVTIAGQIVADVFDTFFEEVALAELE